MKNALGCIEVVRYIRPNTHDIRWNSENKYLKNDNLHGITILFYLDHKRNVVLAKFSVCNGDNFDRETGKMLAENSRSIASFDMSEVKEHNGLINALTNHLSTLVYGDAALIMDYDDYRILYLKAQRKLVGR